MLHIKRDSDLDFTSLVSISDSDLDFTSLVSIIN